MSNLNKKSSIRINNLMYFFLILILLIPLVLAVRQLASVTITSPTEGITNNTGENWAYSCLNDFGGGSKSGTTLDGNWTYCSGTGCVPDTLLTLGTSDLTGTDADGLYSDTSGNDITFTQTVTVNTAGDYSLRCEAEDQDGPLFQSSIVNITVTGAGDSCSCPASNTNWEINMSDSCTIYTDCNIGTGNITFVSTGNATFNATITAINMGQPPASSILFVGAELRVILG